MYGNKNIGIANIGVEICRRVSRRRKEKEINSLGGETVTIKEDSNNQRLTWKFPVSKRKVAIQQALQNYTPKFKKRKEKKTALVKDQWGSCF